MAVAVSWGQVVGAGLEECRRCHTATEGAAPAWVWEQGGEPRASAVPYR